MAAIHLQTHIVKSGYLHIACRQFRRESGELKLSPKEVMLYLTIVLLFCGLALGAYYGERLNNEQFIASSRADTEKKLGEVRSRLEVNLQGDIQLVKGLVSHIAAHPEIGQEEFERAAKPLFEGGSNLRNIGAAPGMVMRMMYPMKGNEKAIGLDFRKRPDQLATADLARTTGQLILAGPLQLVQGGNGIIGRIPVFVEEGKGKRRFWGLISAVIDADMLFRSGLNDADMTLELALRGKDGMGSQGEVFFGRPELFDADPVLADITVPGGTWQIAAIPHGGWPVRADNTWTLRLTFLLIGLLILVPFLALARSLGLQLNAQRKQSETLDLLNTVMKLLPTGLWVLDKDGKVVFNSDAAQRIWGGVHYVGIEQLGEYKGWRADTGAKVEAHEWAGARALEKGETVIDEEIEIECFDGTRKTILDSAVPIRRSDGSIGGAVTVNSDITERKQAETALQEQKNFLAAIFENEPECVKVTDSEGKLLQMNPAGLAMLEVDSVEEVNRCGLVDFVMPEHRVAFRNLSLRVFKGESGVLEFEVQGKEGTHRWLETHAAPLRDANGKITHLLGVTRDVTRRREAEERLALALKGSDLAMTDWHIPSDTLYFGEGWTRLLGYKLEELAPCTATLAKLVRPEDVASARNSLVHHLKGETPSIDAELRMRHKDGHWVWVLARGMAVERAADGRAVRVAGTAMDITGRKAAESEIARLSQWNELLLNSAGEGIYGVDMEGKCTFINPAALAILGFNKEEVLGKNQHVIFHHHRHKDGSPYPREECPVYQTLQDGVQRRVEDAFIRKNKEVFPVQLTVTAMHEAGQIVGVEAVFQDIAQRKEMEQELMRLATTDSLTGASNRRHFIELMEMELAHHIRFGQPAAFLMVDIDFFKRVNDTYGHASGDLVLHHFAELARQRLRRIDLFGRLGGEEFGILLPGTDAEGAKQFAERFRGYVADTPALCDDFTIPLTVSIGVAVFEAGDVASDSIMARADMALYRAKADGRNRVESR